jgi:hypothetical protein
MLVLLAAGDIEYSSVLICVYCSFHFAVIPLIMKGLISRHKFNSGTSCASQITRYDELDKISLPIMYRLFVIVTFISATLLLVTCVYCAQLHGPLLYVLHSLFVVLTGSPPVSN